MKSKLGNDLCRYIGFEQTAYIIMLYEHYSVIKRRVLDRDE